MRWQERHSYRAQNDGGESDLLLEQSFLGAVCILFRASCPSYFPVFIRSRLAGLGVMQTHLTAAEVDLTLGFYWVGQTLRPARWLKVKGCCCAYCQLATRSEHAARKSDLQV